MSDDIAEDEIVEITEPEPADPAPVSTASVPSASLPLPEFNLSRIDEIMIARGYYRIHGKGVFWYERQYEYKGRPVYIQVVTGKYIAPISFGDPVYIVAHDDLLHDVAGPWRYPSLKAFLDDDVNEIIRKINDILQEKQEKEIDEI
jgi:hypothetical protein